MSNTKYVALFWMVASLMMTRHICSADTIGQAFQARAPEVIDFLNRHDLRTIGIVKFEVDKPTLARAESAGPLRSLLADRFEVSLILANPFTPDRQIQIIKDASGQLAQISAANHLTPDGRKACFAAEFELAWGTDRRTADALLSGTLRVHDGLKRGTVRILCYQPGTSQPDEVIPPFDVDLDVNTLAEIGESFQLRGVDGQGVVAASNSAASNITTAPIDTQAATESLRVRDGELPFPLTDPTAAVQLIVKYDDRSVPVQLRDGAAFIPEPRPGQQVTMTLRRNPQVEGRLGVVLKVNGENTLYRQTRRDVDCAMWLLSRKHPETTVRGYQVRDQQTLQKFTVLSREQSQKRAFDYGRQLGQIRISVFQEQRESNPQVIIDEDQEDLLTLLTGMQSYESAKNLSALKMQMRHSIQMANSFRGVIAEGESATSRVNEVEFHPQPNPIMSATVTYYTPQ